MTHQEIELLDVLDKALQTLTDKQRKVIELRFGLINRESLTYDKIAKQCGVSQSCVYLTMQTSIRKIRRYIYKNKILTDTNLPNNNNKTT